MLIDKYNVLLFYERFTIYFTLGCTIFEDWSQVLKHVHIKTFWKISSFIKLMIVCKFDGFSEDKIHVVLYKNVNII